MSGPSPLHSPKILNLKFNQLYALNRGLFCEKNMAIQQINLGSQPRGVGGDDSREAGEKINANFEDLDERVASAKSVADSKTTNATDAHLLNRSNHTGTQSISTILGLQVALDSAASQIDITGNASTAGKLKTPVQINGVPFDGSQSINIETGITYTAMTATTANAGTATTAQIISPSVLKQAIQTHAPTGGGGMNFAAKVEIELEIILDFSSGNYHTSGNILSVSNQANIASAVLDGNGILCLTFNTPISNPNLIATTKNEVKTVTHEGVDYSYLTSTQNGNFNYSMGNYESYGIFQYAENGYVNTNTKLYISCNLYVYPNYGGTSMLRSTFPARFNLGIIDA